MERINITLTDEVLKKIDRLAMKERRNRSDFIRRIVNFYEKYITEEARRKRNIGKAITIQDSLRRKSSSWDAVTELRRQRDNR